MVRNRCYQNADWIWSVFTVHLKKQWSHWYSLEWSKRSGKIFYFEKVSWKVSIVLWNKQAVTKEQAYYAFIVRLSLQTMTNPIQLCDVLLFVCSKMADETNLSSKPLVADRTRAVWGRKLCWWCLSSGFPLGTYWFISLRIHQLPFLWCLAFYQCL